MRKEWRKIINQTALATYRNGDQHILLFGHCELLINRETHTDLVSEFVFSILHSVHGLSAYDTRVDSNIRRSGTRRSILLSLRNHEHWCLSHQIPSLHSYIRRPFICIYILPSEFYELQNDTVYRDVFQKRTYSSIVAVNEIQYVLLCHKRKDSYAFIFWILQQLN
jgi:hypothetical protein